MLANDAGEIRLQRVRERERPKSERGMCGKNVRFEGPSGEVRVSYLLLSCLSEARIENLLQLRMGVN